MQPWFACAPAHARQHARLSSMHQPQRFSVSHGHPRRHQFHFPKYHRAAFGPSCHSTRPRASGGHWVKNRHACKVQGPQKLGGGIGPRRQSCDNVNNAFSVLKSPLERTKVGFNAQKAVNTPREIPYSRSIRIKDCGVFLQIFCTVIDAVFTD